MKKIIFLGLVLILLSSFVTAELNDSELYYSLDNDNLSGSNPLDVSGNGRDGVKGTGTNTGVPGVIKQGFNFTGSGNGIEFPAIPQSATGSLCGWFNFSSVDAQGRAMWNFANSSVTNRQVIYCLELSGEVTCALRTGGAGARQWEFTTDSFNVAANTYQHICLVQDNSEPIFYVNGTSLAKTFGFSADKTDWTEDLSGIPSFNRVGFYAGLFLNGSVDEIAIYNRNISQAEAAELFNNGAGFNPYAEVIPKFSFTLSDIFNNSVITNFTLQITNETNSTNITTTNNSVGWPGAQTVNLTFFNITGVEGVYFNLTLSDVNISLQGNATPLFTIQTTTYSNFTAFFGLNYTRNLEINVTASCQSGLNTTLFVLADNVVVEQSPMPCLNETVTSTALNYSHTSEGNTSIAVTLNNTDFALNNRSFQFFIYDLANATVSDLTMFIENNFNSSTINFSMTCTDTVMANMTYNMTFNGVAAFLGNLTNNTKQLNSSTATNGFNNLTGECTDLFATTQRNLSSEVFFRTITLINEVDKTAFDVSNVSDARVYFNETNFFSFTDEGNHQVNVSSLNESKLRITIEYVDATIVTRLIDMNLVDATNLRVCANTDDVTHFEQILVSATEREAIMLSNFANCLVAADTTRFALQDSFILKAFTITTLYFLKTIDIDGNEIILASVDGSISTTINLDNLEFRKQAYNLAILGDALTFDESGTDEILIRYENFGDTNIALNITITDLTDGTIVFQTGSFADPNEFTLFFNYATLNVTNATLYQLELIKTTAEGKTPLRRFFNPQAGSGIIKTEIAIAISLLLTLFGLTMTSSRLTFSWFGIMVQLLSIVSLSFGTVTTTSKFLMVVDFIILIYMFLILKDKNVPTVA